MHGYIFFHWDDLNRNGNLKEWKLIIHGYTILNGGELNEDETLTKETSVLQCTAVVYLWDRRINVSLKISQNVCNFLLNFVIENIRNLARYLSFFQNS